MDGLVTHQIQREIAEIVQPSPFSIPPSQKQETIPELLVVATPQKIDWQQHHSFPLLVLEIRSNQRGWEVHSRQNRLVVISSLETGETGIIAPVVLGRRMPVLPPSGSGDPLSDFDAGLSTVTVLNYDLLRWIQKDHYHGRIALSIVEYDLRSNTVIVDVQLDTDKSHIPEAAMMRSAGIPVKTEPVAFHVSGISWQVPETISADRETKMSAQIRLARHHVTILSSPSAHEDSLFVATTLLFVRLDNLNPFVFN